MKRTQVVGVMVGLVGVVLASCGSGGPAAPATGTAGEVSVSMVDIEFEPDVLEVAAGEEITFVFANDGKLEHEALIGTAAEQEEHDMDMNREMPGEEKTDDGHDAGAEALTLQPGESGSLTHTFDEPGDYLIGCHVPGHWDAGMKITVTVA